MKMMLHNFRYLFVCALVANATFFFALNATAADPHFVAEAAFHPGTIAPGQKSVLSINIQIPDGFILYSPTHIADGPLALQIIPSTSHLTEVGPWFGSPPKVKRDEAFKTNVEFYQKHVTFQRVYQVGEPTGAIPIRIRGQICDKQSCYNQDFTLSAPIRINPEAGAQTSAPTLTGIAFDKSHKIGRISSQGEINNPEKLGLFPFIFMAILAGFGALLTPCVFPMIPITISFFSKYQNISASRNIIMAGVYAGSIIVVYTIPGVVLSMLFGAGSMQLISTHPVFNIFIASLLIFFGLNLIGLFELRIPNWLIQKSADKEHQLNNDHFPLGKQIAGVFFMAITFTLVSFSCTVGFVGGWVLPLAARGDALYPLIGMIAFSSAFALPFFLLAIFPAAAKLIQGRGGDWMVSVKALFGVVELAASTKFISNLDLHFEWNFLTRDIVLGIWTACFLGGTAVSLNLFSKKATQIRKISAIRILLALILLGFAIKSFSGIGHTRPMGGWLDGWLPPVPYPSHAPKEDDSKLHLSYIIDDLPHAIKLAQNANEALFIDFTGFQCANCRQMETNYFPRTAVKKRLEKMTRVKLFTDGPKPVHQQQRDYQLNQFHTAVLPFYVIIDPQSDSVLATFSSLAQSESEFVAFLDKGLLTFTQSSTPASPPLQTTPSASNSESPKPLVPLSPPITFTLNTLLDNQPIQLSSFRGNWVLLNFWASYCSPCKKELSDSFPSALKKAPHLKLVTVAIEYEETIDAAKQFITSSDLLDHIHLVADDEWRQTSLPPSLRTYFGLPSSFLLSPNGEVVWQHKGAIESSHWTQILKKTLN